MKESIFQLIRSGPEELTLTSNDGQIPLHLLGGYLESLPLYQALGCLGCERLIWEAQDRLSQPRTPQEALFHDQIQHPEISIRFDDGFTLVCPLLSDSNTSPHLRKTKTPCQEKQQIIVDLSGFQ